MLTIFKTSTAVWLAVGLGGCVGAAGVSTWDYRSGSGYETSRVQENRIQIDSAQGLTQEACTSISRRQAAASGRVTGTDLTACQAN
jgi:hypothetical protein